MRENQKKLVHLHLIRNRLRTFELTFQKHADLCDRCYALVIWGVGTPKPQQCRRCGCFFKVL